MKIIPARPYIFVQEDTEDYSAYKETGLELPEEAKKGVGTTGTIYSIHPEDETGMFKVGQRVIFDRFIANDIAIRDEKGQEIPRLQCLPLDCVLGFIL